MICSHIYKATTLAAVLLISATASAETTEAPRRLAPLPGSTSTSTTAEGKDFSLQLAKAELAEQGIRHPTQRQIDAARSSIQARRSRGEGWGEIAHSLGLNFGKVVSASNHREQDGKQDGKHAEKGERKNTRDGFATVSHRSTQGEGGGDTHGGHSDHSSGSSGSRGNGGGSSHSK
jgi:hypothetical protein